MKRDELRALAERLKPMASAPVFDGLDMNAIDAALRQIAEAQPVCWGWPASDGVVYDTIVPQEHQRHEGKYTTPLYTLPLED